MDYLLRKSDGIRLESSSGFKGFLNNLSKLITKGSQVFLWGTCFFCQLGFNVVWNTMLTLSYFSQLERCQLIVWNFMQTYERWDSGIIDYLQNLWGSFLSLSLGLLVSVKVGNGSLLGSSVISNHGRLLFKVVRVLFTTNCKLRINICLNSNRRLIQWACLLLQNSIFRFPLKQLGKCICTVWLIEILSYNLASTSSHT